MLRSALGPFTFSLFVPLLPFKTLANLNFPKQKEMFRTWERASLMVPLKPHASGIGRAPYNEESWNVLSARVISNPGESWHSIWHVNVLHSLSTFALQCKSGCIFFSFSSQYQILIQRVLRKLTAKVCKLSGRGNRCIRSPCCQELPLSRITGLKSYRYS